jgi:hypothetical protein
MLFTPKHRIEVYEGDRGGFFWRARHIATMKIVADGSEPYSTRSNARRAARRIGRVLFTAPVIDIREKIGAQRVR